MLMTGQAERVPQQAGRGASRDSRIAQATDVFVVHHMAECPSSILKMNGCRW
jgi:hypothetical protein